MGYETSYQGHKPPESLVKSTPRNFRTTQKETAVIIHFGQNPKRPMGSFWCLLMKKLHAITKKAKKKHVLKKSAKIFIFQILKIKILNLQPICSKSKIRLFFPFLAKKLLSDWNGNAHYSPIVQFFKMPFFVFRNRM